MSLWSLFKVRRQPPVAALAPPDYRHLLAAAQELGTQAGATVLEALEQAIHEPTERGPRGQELGILTGHRTHSAGGGARNFCTR